MRNADKEAAFMLCVLATLAYMAFITINYGAALLEVMSNNVVLVPFLIVTSAITVGKFVYFVLLHFLQSID